MRTDFKENKVVGPSLQVEALIPTEWGSFYMSAYSKEHSDYTPHIVLRHPEMDATQPVYVRVHSECITGDVFHSQKCDCGQQLQKSMKMIAEHKGMLVYLRQEGRGIGIINKLKAYKFQEKGMDTIQANEALGFEPDYRNYKLAASILKSLGITKVRLITNNPDKISDLKQEEIEVVERIPIIIDANSNSKEYLKTKEERMGHLLFKEDQ